MFDNAWAKQTDGGGSHVGQRTSSTPGWGTCPIKMTQVTQERQRQCLGENVKGCSIQFEYNTTQLYLILTSFTHSHTRQRRRCWATVRQILAPYTTNTAHGEARTGTLNHRLNVLTQWLSTFLRTRHPYKGSFSQWHLVFITLIFLPVSSLSKRATFLAFNYACSLATISTLLYVPTIVTGLCQ